MKKATILFSSILLLFAVVFVGCKKDPVVPVIPDVPVTGVTPLTGNLKLGTTITVQGTGFDEWLDVLEIWVSDTVSSVIGSDLITFSSDKITFGIKPSTGEAGMTVDIKVSREGFNSVIIAKGVTLIVPTLAEGWIPNAQFKIKLREQGGNPLFLQYDMFDIEAAKTWLSNNTTGGDPQGDTALMMDAPVASYEGLEFLKKIEKLLSWNNGAIQVIDLTNTNIELLYCDGCGKLNTIIPGPKTRMMNYRNCRSLKTLDTRPAPLCNLLVGIEGEQVTVLDALDLRKPKALWPTADKPVDWSGQLIFVMSTGGNIKISEYYYLNHNAFDLTFGWNCLVNEFVNKGCTVEVWNDEGTAKLFDGTDASGAHPIVFKN